MSPLYLLLEYVIAHDRIDIFHEFIQLLSGHINVDVLIISYALRSDNSWRIYIYIYIKTKYSRSTLSILQLIGYALKSSNFAHFILIERLFNTSGFRHLVLERILNAGSVEILAYYSLKYPKDAQEYLGYPIELLSRAPNSRILSFYVLNVIYTRSRT